MQGELSESAILTEGIFRLNYNLSDFQCYKNPCLHFCKQGIGFDSDFIFRIFRDLRLLRGLHFLNDVVRVLLQVHDTSVLSFRPQYRKTF